MTPKKVVLSAAIVGFVSAIMFFTGLSLLFRGEPIEKPKWYESDDKKKEYENTFFGYPMRPFSLALFLCGGSVMLGLSLSAKSSFIIHKTIVTKHNELKRCLAEIEVFLQMKCDLIDKMLSIASKFMTLQKETLDGVAKARAFAASKNSSENYALVDS